MQVTQLLLNLGQSIWLYNIKRDLLNGGARHPTEYLLRRKATS
jgi:hypothetical protein